MNRRGTSIPEQSIFYYVKQFFPDTQNRFTYKSLIDNTTFEIDIYVPSIKIAIEYDGAFWHKNKVKEDAQKNLILNNDGIYVIRIRDLACPKLPDFVGKVFYHGKAPKGMHTNEYIQAVINEIAQFCLDNNLAKVLNDFELSFQKYIEDQPDILSLLYPEKVTPNKGSFCGAEYWDEKANGRLSLENISVDDSANIFVNFRCKMCQPIHAPIKVLCDKTECKIKCDSCISNICIFMANYCKGHCDVVYKQINDYLVNNALMAPKPGNFAYYYLNEAPWLIKFIESRINNDDSNYIDRFNKYFGFPIFLRRETISILSVGDLKIAREYCEKCGGLIDFEIMIFDNSEDKINAVKDYFSAVYDKIIDLKNNDAKFIYEAYIYRNYIHAIYCYWSRNKIQMSEQLQSVIISFIQSVEEVLLSNAVEFRHKFN